MTRVDSGVRFRPLRFGWAEMRSAAEQPAAEIVLAGVAAIGRNQEAADRRCHRVRLTAGTARPGARQRGPLAGLKSGVLILSSIPMLASAPSDDQGVQMAKQGLASPSRWLRIRAWIRNGACTGSGGMASPATRSMIWQVGCT